MFSLWFANNYSISRTLRDWSYFRNYQRVIEITYILFIIVNKQWFVLDLASENKQHKSRAFNGSHQNSNKFEAKEEKGDEGKFQISPWYGVNFEIHNTKRFL